MALPIACVEGWSTSDQWWRGVRLRDLAAARVGHGPQGRARRTVLAATGSPPAARPPSAAGSGLLRRPQVADPRSLARGVRRRRGAWPGPRPPGPDHRGRRAAAAACWNRPRGSPGRRWVGGAAVRRRTRVAVAIGSCLPDAARAAWLLRACAGWARTACRLLRQVPATGAVVAGTGSWEPPARVGACTTMVLLARCASVRSRPGSGSRAGLARAAPGSCSPYGRCPAASSGLGRGCRRGVRSRRPWSAAGSTASYEVGGAGRTVGGRLPAARVREACSREAVMSAVRRCCSPCGGAERGAGTTAAPSERARSAEPAVGRCEAERSSRPARGRTQGWARPRRGGEYDVDVRSGRGGHGVHPTNRNRTNRASSPYETRTSAARPPARGTPTAPRCDADPMHQHPHQPTPRLRPRAGLRSWPRARHRSPAGLRPKPGPFLGLGPRSSPGLSPESSLRPSPGAPQRWVRGRLRDGSCGWACGRLRG
ncbi:hypothetical protein STENM327S_06446 [Streptomyces tendae]